MQLLEVRVDNVRGVPTGEGALKLSFQSKHKRLPQWIVFAGRNGAGKSTLMQAIALAIGGPSIARLLAESFDGWIRDGQKQATVGAKLSFSDDDGFTTGRKPTFDPWTAISWQRANGPEPVMERHSVGGRWTPDRGPWAENPKGWFLAGYGPFRRLSPAPSEALRLMMSPGRPAALASLFREDASLSESVQWLQRIYLQRLEKRPEAEALEKLVLALLDNGLLPEGMRVRRVDSQGLWVETPSKQTFPLTALSDGYRTVAGLVLDLVKQIHASRGNVPYEVSDDGQIRILHEGVVLIDEVDVHLHVEWQRRIGFWLKAHFPGLQFIVSTHSPFICQAADPGGLVRLSPAWEDGPAAAVVEGETYNRVVNGTVDDALLAHLFGLDSTLSHRAQRDRARLADLEAKRINGLLGNSEEAELRELSSRMPRSHSTLVESALRLLNVD